MGETPVPRNAGWGTVIGHATSMTAIHRFHGLKLVIVQPLNVRREPEADPVVAVDRFHGGSRTDSHHQQRRQGRAREICRQ